MVPSPHETLAEWMSRVQIVKADFTEIDRTTFVHWRVDYERIMLGFSSVTVTVNVWVAKSPSLFSAFTVTV